MKKIITIPILLGSFFVVLLAVVFAIQWPSLLQKFPVTQGTEQVDISNWQTYQTEVDGISFKYPDVYSVDPAGPLSGIDVDLQLVKIKRTNWLSGQNLSIVLNKYNYKPEGVLDIAPVYLGGEKIFSSDQDNEVTRKIESARTNLSVADKDFPRGRVVYPGSLQKITTENGTIWLFSTFMPTHLVEDEFKKAFVMILDNSDVVVTGTEWGGTLFDDEVLAIVKSFKQSGQFEAP